MEELNILYDFLRMNQQETKEALMNIVKEYYTNDKIDINENYIYCTGKYPILLVAHMDTVYDHSFYSCFGNGFFKQIKNKKIFYDRCEEVIWSPQGLGADDKAGIFIILKLLRNGILPSVLFTTDEEIGGKGAKNFSEDYKNKFDKDIKFIIELDRKGKNDAIFYNCNNLEFESYIQSYGFFNKTGTFTDISIICPFFDIAGANLSVGYYEEHTPSEYLSLLQNDKIYDIIYYMVKESKKFETPFKYNSNEASKLERCCCCNLFIPKKDIEYIKDKGFLCKDCMPFFK